MPVRIPPDNPPDPRFETARALEGPLSAQLAKFDGLLNEELPAFWVAYQRLVEHLTKVGVGSNVPASGAPLPPFQLPDEKGRLVSSADLLAKGPLVVTFNRGNWCPYCWLELSALEDNLSAIVANGGSVVSITPEVAPYSQRLKRQLHLSFPVLTDLDNGYALELGLAVALGDDVRSLYESVGIDLGTFQRSSVWLLPLPATLVIDPQGIVRHSYVNANFRKRFDPAGLPDLLRKL